MKEQEKEDSNEVNSEEEGVIRCICGYDDDDGNTIQCEKCLVWQHMACFEINEDNVPAHYFCEQCEPREVDKQKAKDRQKKKNGKVGRKKKRKESTKKKEEIEDDFIAITEDYIPIKKNFGNEDDFRELSKRARGYEKDSLSSIIESSSNVTVMNVAVHNPAAAVTASIAATSSNTNVNLPNNSTSTPAITSNTNGTGATTLTRKKFNIKTGLGIKVLLKEAFVFPMYNDNELIFLLDARQYGNESRFIRYSCKPNSHFRLVKDDEGEDLHLCIYSIQSLSPGDEILVSYNDLIGSSDAQIQHEKISAGCACDSIDTCLYRPKQPQQQSLLYNVSYDSSLSESEFEEIQVFSNSNNTKNDSNVSDIGIGSNERRKKKKKHKDQDDLFSKPDKLLSREERKIRDELLRFARMENNNPTSGENSIKSNNNNSNTYSKNSTNSISSSSNKKPNNGRKRDSSSKAAEDYEEPEMHSKGEADDESDLNKRDDTDSVVVVVDVMDDDSSTKLNNTISKNSRKSSLKREKIYQFKWKQKMLWRYMEEVNSRSEIAGSVGVSSNNSSVSGKIQVEEEIAISKSPTSMATAPNSQASSPVRTGIKRGADEVYVEEDDNNRDLDTSLSAEDVNSNSYDHKPKEQQKQTRITLKDYKKKRKIIQESNTSSSSTTATTDNLLRRTTTTESNVSSLDSLKEERNTSA